MSMVSLYQGFSFGWVLRELKGEALNCCTLSCYLHGLPVNILHCRIWPLSKILKHPIIITCSAVHCEIKVNFKTTERPAWNWITSQFPNHKRPAVTPCTVCVDYTEHLFKFLCNFFLQFMNEFHNERDVWQYKSDQLVNFLQSVKLLTSKMWQLSLSIFKNGQELAVKCTVAWGDMHCTVALGAYKYCSWGTCTVL